MFLLNKLIKMEYQSLEGMIFTLIHKYLYQNEINKFLEFSYKLLFLFTQKSFLIDTKTFPSKSFSNFNLILYS